MSSHQPHTAGRLRTGNRQGQVPFHAGFSPNHPIQIPPVIKFERKYCVVIDVNQVTGKEV
jgi:hypothetical protein